MSSSRSRASRVFTISFPEDLAAQVEKLAKHEGRNISELFREAFRAYRVERMQRKLPATRAIAAARSAPRYTEEDMVFECALKAEGEIILSGDNDLLSVKTFRGIQVLTVRQYLDRFTPPPA